jgi:hypothetical protein
MNILGPGPSEPGLPNTDVRADEPDSRPAILILGACRGGVFVAGDVLICADTLGTEEAIRAWLAAHAIHVGSPAGLTVKR